MRSHPACPGTWRAREDAQHPKEKQASSCLPTRIVVGQVSLPALLVISTGPASHQPNHSVQKGDYEIERDYYDGKDQEYRFIASRTPEIVIE